MAEPTAETEAPWPSLSTAEALARVGSARDGLAAAEAKARLERFGPNRLRPPRRRGPLSASLLQFHNVLIYVLLAAGAVTALLGHCDRRGVILGVVVINAVIGFVQEGKAEQALDAIRNMLVAAGDRCCATAGASPCPPRTLVPGDVVLSCKSGDKVPADLRLIAGQEPAGRGGGADRRIGAGRQVGRAGGGGCAAGRSRRRWPSPARWSPPARAAGVVVATGDATEIGRISALLRDVEDPDDAADPTDGRLRALADAC